MNGEPGDWKGAVVYRSTDGGMSFTEFESVFTQAKAGVAAGALADPGMQWASWDRVNTIDIQMINGTLSNASIVDTLNLSNLALLGNELIGFTTAPPPGLSLSSKFSGFNSERSKPSPESAGDRFSVRHPEKGNQP